MSAAFLRSRHFWGALVLTLLITGLFFAWELNMLSLIGLAGPPRPTPSSKELVMTILIVVLLSLNAGLIIWHRKEGTCPTGLRRATGTAGAMGALALICPACTLVPLGIAGISLSLAVLAPFIPLLQIIALVLLSASTFLLLSKGRDKTE